MEQCLIEGAESCAEGCRVASAVIVWKQGRLAGVVLVNMVKSCSGRAKQSCLFCVVGEVLPFAGKCMNVVGEQGLVDVASVAGAYASDAGKGLSAGSVGGLQGE